MRNEEKRYSKSNKAEWSRLLTEMGAMTRLHFKSLIRLMGMSDLERVPGARIEAQALRQRNSQCSASNLGEPGQEKMSELLLFGNFLI